MRRRAFFRLCRAWPATIAGLCALALYVRTAAPGLTWAHHGADGGDFLAAALTHGVPHPPGAPTYLLFLSAAVALLPQAPARAGNLLSATAAALAVALLTDLARRALSNTAGRVRHAAALAAGLTWATSPGLWSQATITEAYALNALAVVLILWLAWRWQEATNAGRSGRGWLIAGGLAFGLGLGVHLTVALLLPGLLIWLWGRCDRREWMAALATALAGMTTHACLPWAARETPPVNWGDPSTPAGFWWLVSAAIYRPLVFGLPLAELPRRLAAWAAEAGRQFGAGPWGLILALVGLWQMEPQARRWWRMTVLIAAAYTAYGIGYRSVDSHIYLIPAWAMACLWLGQGIAWLAARTVAWRPADSGRGVVIAAVLLAVGLPAAALGRWWADMDLSRDHEAEDFLAAIWEAAAPAAVILVGGDQATFALWYGRYGLGQRPDLTPVNVHLYDFPWYQAALLRHHPHLAAFMGDKTPVPVEEFVIEAARRGPLYRADALAGFKTGLHEEPAGVLMRLWSP